MTRYQDASSSNAHHQYFLIIYGACSLVDIARTTMLVPYCYIQVTVINLKTQAADEIYQNPIFK